MSETDCGIQASPEKIRLTAFVHAPHKYCIQIHRVDIQELAVGNRAKVLQAFMRGTSLPINLEHFENENQEGACTSAAELKKANICKWNPTFLSLLCLKAPSYIWSLSNWMT